MREAEYAPASARQGFTLVESIIAVVIVSFTLVTALEMVGASARLRRTQQEQQMGEELGRQLLDEVIQNYYVHPGVLPVFGPETGETRASYNDVDDYNNFTDSPPTTKDGSSIPGFSNWKRTVRVYWADPASPKNTVSTDKDLKRIVVIVTSPTGRSTTVTALRSSHSAYENQPSAQTTYVSYVGVRLQVGNDPASSVVSGVNLVNQVP